MNKKLLIALQAVSAAAALMVGPAAFAHTGNWDAIAVDDQRGSRGGDAGYGVGTGNSQAIANQEAINACIKAGNSNCQVMLTYSPLQGDSHSCGAYASSRNRYGTGTGMTEAQARANALSACGNAGCQLAVSDCVGQ